MSNVDRFCGACSPLRALSLASRAERRRRHLLCLLLLVPALAASGIGTLAWAQAPLAGEDLVIPPEAAITAALAEVNLFYPGAWRYVSHYVLEDLDDRPASYAVLLARVGGDVPAVSAADVEARVTGGQESVLQLQRSIAEVRSAPGGNAGDRDAQLSKLAGQLAEARRALVGGEIFCTVFTGARSSMPVVRKCQKGLPAFLVEKAEAQARLREVSPSLLITRPLFLDPFSVTYEAAGESGPAGAIVFDLETRRTAQKAELQARRRAAEKQLAAAKSPADTQDLEALRAKNLRAWQRYLPRPGDTKVPIPPGSPAAQPARLGSETGGQK